MNNELVYPLNLPSIYDIIPDLDVCIKEFGPAGFGGRVYTTDMVSPKWKNWLGLPWNTFMTFYKKDGFRPKLAHTDSTDPAINVWGINFHTGGAGLLELYQYEDVTILRKTPDVASRDGEKSYGADYTINNTPVKSYYMPEGAYLVFNSLPHRATGYDNRFCVTLRCTTMWNLSNDEVLDIFKDYIIDKPLLSKVPY